MPRRSTVVGSLLLGLYDDEGLLDHVGFTSAIPARERAALTKELEALIEPPGFTGSAPGGPSRWNTERDRQWKPLKPELVVEVRYDQVTGRRFRHGTGFVRWRPDKDPKQCTFEQLAPELRPVGAQGAVRAVSLLFDEPLIAGLEYREDYRSARPRNGADRPPVAEADLSPFRFQGWLGNRKTQSFGWRYDFDDSSFARPSRFPTGCNRCARGCGGLRGPAAEDFVHVLLARYDPGAGIGWHRDRDVFEKVVGISLAPRRFASASEARRLSARESRCRAALCLSPVGRGAVGLGAPHHARRSAALLDHLPHAVRKGTAHREASGTVRPATVCSHHGARSCCCLSALAACSKGPEADLPNISEARSLAPNGRWSTSRRRRASSPPIMSSTMRTALREQVKTAAEGLTDPGALCARDRGYCSPSPTMLRRTSFARMRTSSRQIEDRLNPLEITLGIMTAVGGFVDISELVFAAKAGSMFGYALIWVFAFSTVGMMVFGEMSGRVAAVAKQPVFNLMRHRLGLSSGW